MWQLIALVTRRKIFAGAKWTSSNCEERKVIIQSSRTQNSHAPFTRFTKRHHFLRLHAPIVLPGREHVVGGDDDGRA